MALLVHAGYTVLVAADDGSIGGEGREGLYDVDSRLLAQFAYAIGDEPLRVVASDLVGPHRWRARLIAPSPGRSPGIEGPGLPQDVLELSIDRAVGKGLVDQVTVTNQSATDVRATLRILAEPDFADVQEVGRERRQSGVIIREAAGGAVTWAYRAARADREIERAVRIAISDPSSPATWRDLEVTVDLTPHGTYSFRVGVESLVEGRWRTPDPTAHERWLARWSATRTRIESTGSDACAAADRAAEDLAALRNDELFGGDDDAWFPNAGVPMFTGFFGRDAITAGWQAAMLDPAMMRGAIEVAARTQAAADDPFRDAEPGKMVHEIRRGPLSMLDVIPQAAYYGTQTTGALFVLALSEWWHWTADRSLLRRHLPAALGVFEWADRYGDLDGDGFLEYRRRSPGGLKNQAWKDSDEAIRYPDGRSVDNPIATVEEQAFFCLALERMAEILVALDDPRADRFLSRASGLRTRWHEAFWLEDEQFYALALDPAKRPVASITSNPGHALAAGVVPPEHARAVADRLLADDLFSGWGVRTLSSRHPSYNPYAYHLGTVWPVEQATFALGFKRYGFDDHVDRLVEGMLAAAAASPGGRLPELLAGVDRRQSPRPIAYPDANAPQAWSASATVQLLQVSLGIYPFAPLGVLALVRPRLPVSIPALTIADLRVGRARVTIRFERRPDGTAAHEVLERQGRLVVIEAGPPGAADDVSWRERLERLALGGLPGRRARAARIALGLEAGQRREP